MTKVKPELQKLVDEHINNPTWSIEDKRVMCAAANKEKQFDEELQDHNENVIFERSLKKLQRKGYIHDAIEDKHWWQRINEAIDDYAAESTSTKREKRLLSGFLKVIAWFCIVVFGLFFIGMGVTAVIAIFTNTFINGMYITMILNDPIGCIGGALVLLMGGGGAIYGYYYY